jgi:hypothetical protein
MRSKRALLITTAVLVAFIGLVLAAGLFVKFKVDDLLKTEVRQALGEGYSFDYTSSRLSIFKSRYTLKGIHLEKSEENQKEWEIEIAELTIDDFKSLHFLRTSNFYLDSLVIVNPDVKIFKLPSRNNSTKSDPSKPTDSKKIGAGWVSLQDGSVTYDPEGPEIFTTAFDLSIDVLELDKIKNISSDHLEPVSLQLKNGLYSTPDSIHEITFDSIEILGSAHEISCANLHYEPRISPEEYPRHYGWRKAHLKASVNSLIATYEIDSLQGAFKIPEIEIDHPNIEIRQDTRYPFPDRRTELPQQLLKNLPFKLKIDTISIRDGELSLNLKQTNNRDASLTVNNLNARIQDAQNISDTLPALSLRASALMNNRAEVKVAATYFYGFDDPFTLEGEVGNTRLRFMDDFLRTMAGITIASGQLDKMTFSMDGNTNTCSGHVDFYYEELSIHLVDKENSQDKKFLNTLSDVFGSLVFWKENPSKSGFRRGSFSVVRDKRKGFISQIVDGLMEGILNTVSKIDPDKIQNNDKPSRKHKGKKQ